MKIKTISVVFCLSFAMILAGCGLSHSKGPAENTQTGSNEVSAKEDLKAQALSAYLEILKAAPAIDGEQPELADASFGYEQNQQKFGKHYDLFALSDLNQDGIPELIALSTVNFRWTPVSVFTYAEGNVLLLKDPLNTEAHGTFEQMSTANGAYSTYICDQNHIHSVWRGTNPFGGEEEENNAYSLAGTTLTKTDCTSGENEKTVYFYDIAKVNTNPDLTE